MGDSTWPLSTMARTVLSLALLACLGLAILHLVSAQEQNKEQEDKTPNNVVIQIKPEEQKMRLLREADPSKNESSKKCKSGKRDQNGKCIKKKGKGRSKNECRNGQNKNGKCIKKRSRNKCKYGKKKNGKCKKRKDRSGNKCKYGKNKNGKCKKRKDRSGNKCKYGKKKKAREKKKKKKKKKS